MLYNNSLYKVYKQFSHLIPHFLLAKSQYDVLNFIWLQRVKKTPIFSFLICLKKLMCIAPPETNELVFTMAEIARGIAKKEEGDLGKIHLKSPLVESEIGLSNRFEDD